MPPRKPEKVVPLMLRLPADLHRLLVREADAAAVSLNAEIIRRLRAPYVEFDAKRQREIEMQEVKEATRVGLEEAIRRIEARFGAVAIEQRAKETEFEALWREYRASLAEDFRLQSEGSPEAEKSAAKTALLILKLRKAAEEAVRPKLGKLAAVGEPAPPSQSEEVAKRSVNK